MSQGGPTGDERIDENHLLVTDDVIIPFCPFFFFFTEGWTDTEGWTENKDFLKFCPRIFVILFIISPNVHILYAWMLCVMFE